MSKIISILLLDSDQNTISKLEKYFQNKNIKIIGLTNIKKVLEELDLNPPDAILINKDIEENLKLINDTGRLIHIPKLFLTIRGLKEDRIQGYKLGCNAYIPKPFDPEELEAIISNIVNQTKNKISWLLETYIKLKKSRVKLLKSLDITQTQSIILTPQEKKILKKIIENKTNNQIAMELNLTTRNIEKHITNIVDKTKTAGKQGLKTLKYMD